MPPRPDSLIFDLDGTLWDTTSACAASWNHAVKQRGIAFRTIAPSDIASVAGMPNGECVRSVFAGLPERQIEDLILDTAAYDIRFIGEMGGSLYEGVEEGLRRLAQRWPLFIVSNCQSGYIEAFLDQTGFGRLFADFECHGSTGLGKAENLQLLIARNRIESPIFVGDTDGDRQAAQQARMPFLHVAYGFGRTVKGESAFSTFAELTLWFESL